MMVERKITQERPERIREPRDRFYNQKIKEQFLKEHAKKTSSIYKYTFTKSAEMEEFYKRDLCDFNLEQIKYTMHRINPSTISSASGQLSIIKNYITFCKENGYSNKSNVNILDGLPKNWIFQFIDSENKIYYTKEEIEDIAKELVNAQDALLIMLLFEGVNGYQASEILNLKIENLIDENNGYKLKLKCDKHGERIIKPSSFLAKLIIEANREEFYLKKNGMSESKSQNAELIENGYVVKPAKIGRRRISEDSELNKIDKHNIYRRIKMIKEIFELKSLTPKNIERSGMLYEMKEMIKNEERELMNDEIEYILNKFGYKKVNTKDGERYNSSYFREILNYKTLEVVYDLKEKEEGKEGF